MMNRRKFLGVSAAGTVTFFAGDMLLEAQRLEVTHHAMVIGTSSGKTVSMVQISDLHLQGFGRHEEHIVHATNNPRPDFIVLTGDSIDNRAKLGVLMEFMSHLDSSVPMFAILGNWEYWSGVDLNVLSTVYSRYNCQLLVNKSAKFNVRGSSIRLAGFDDYIGGHRSRAALEDVSPVDGEILLAHCPQHRDVVADRISPMISGHTHGGQINLGAFVNYAPSGSGHYLKGWYKKERLYVSRGLGTSRVPLRLNSVPELVRFDLLL